MVMGNRMRAVIWALCGCLLAAAAVCAETAPAPPKQALLAAQAQRAVQDLVSMKSNGRLLPSDEEVALDASWSRPPC
jgi:hypothetical protein